MADVMAPPAPMPQQQPSPIVEQDRASKPTTEFKPILSPQQLNKAVMPPSASSTPIPNAAGVAVARRPPRKSTLTQQQRNHKRQRATQDQLMTLEVEFNNNPTPTATVRERIAEEINMTERSVQIWFQNRRAKIKNIAKKSIESGEDCDQIPESMRQYLAMQQFGPHKGMAGGMLGGPGYFPYGAGMLPAGSDVGTEKSIIHHLNCRSLSIGTWRRVGKAHLDLVIFYCSNKAYITYYIHNNEAGYKIEYPFAWIKNITLEHGDAQSAAEGASQRPGGLIIELVRPPRFFMDSSPQGFYECGDFTEDQQASQVLVHHLGGPSKVLSGQLAKLISLEAYQSRHSVFNPAGMAMSAPVSPLGIPRPASQPNNPVHPHHAMHLSPPEAAPGLMGPPAPRGHKRQRSRSVPIAIDFSMLRHQMPSFLIQHEAPQPQHAIQHNPNIWAPVPQHQHPNPFMPNPPPAADLSVDTSAGYPTFPFGAPMSATTANTPSEFGPPPFFTSAPSSDALQQAHFTTPFNNGFLAVDPASMIGTSNTPLSMASSHHDPVIADQSPPLNGIGRSQSADIFDTTGENVQFGDDSIFLADSFNKQIALPFRTPYTEDAFQSPMPDGAFHFDDPASLSGSDSQMHNGGALAFQSPPADVQNGSLSLQSPQSQNTVSQTGHVDSGVSFSTTPSHLSPVQTSLYTSPKDGTPVAGVSAVPMLYHDGQMYSSPSQLHTPGVEQPPPIMGPGGTIVNAGYHRDPLAQPTPNEELNMQNFGMFHPGGTIDPTNLGQPMH